MICILEGFYFDNGLFLCMGKSILISHCFLRDSDCADYTLRLGIPLRPGPGPGLEGHPPRAPTCPGPIYHLRMKNVS